MLTIDGIGGYEFTKIRKYVELAAILGYVICRAVVSGDRGVFKQGYRE